jgi:hypothetical protein
MDPKSKKALIINLSSNKRTACFPKKMNSINSIPLITISQKNPEIQSRRKKDKIP